MSFGRGLIRTRGRRRVRDGGGALVHGEWKAGEGERDVRGKNRATLIASVGTRGGVEIDAERQGVGVGELAKKRGELLVGLGRVLVDVSAES